MFLQLHLGMLWMSYHWYGCKCRRGPLVENQEPESGSVSPQQSSEEQRGRLNPPEWHALDSRENLLRYCIPHGSEMWVKIRLTFHWKENIYLKQLLMALKAIVNISKWTTIHLQFMSLQNSRAYKFFHHFASDQFLAVLEQPSLLPFHKKNKRLLLSVLTWTR